MYAGTAGESEVMTLRDMLRLEGRATELVKGCFPSLLTPQFLAFSAPDDWCAALAHAAELCGVETYDDLRTNPARIAAHLYGDEVVAPQGHAGVGVPPFGGVAVAHLQL